MVNRFPPPPFPDPLPVSQPAWPLPAVTRQVVGDNGPQYGIQQAHKWALNDVRSIQVLDTLKTESLWRISVFGRVFVSILYGTSRARTITDLMAPVVITVPGQALVTVRPRDNQGTTCIVNLTKATAGALAIARKYVDDSGGSIAFDPDAVRFFSLAASSLTIAGVVVAVPAFTTVPLVAGSGLISGSGFQEFEA